MHLTLSSCGEQLATLDAGSHWQLDDVLMTLPERFRASDCRARVFCGTEELFGSRTLSDVGAGSGAVLTVVLSKLPRVPPPPPPVPCFCRFLLCICQWCCCCGLVVVVVVLWSGW